MKCYCQQCNQPTEYQGFKPRFCSACGVAFGTRLVGEKAAVVHAQQRLKEAEDDVEISKIVEIPNLSRLDVEIIPYKAQASSLKDMVLSGLDGPRDFERPVENNLDKVREEWKREASAGRQQLDETKEIQEEDQD